MAGGFTEADIPDQRGRTAIVTGANTGIGFEIARALAGKGARVLLGCRDEDKARQAMARIASQVPGAALAFLPLDQADLGSVRRAAEIAAGEDRLDLLVNNAGVMFPPLTRTAQGHELQFGVNHLGTFALTGLLLPKLAGCPGARVVVTSSLAHRRGRIQWDDIDAQRGYHAANRYGDSKLMNLLHVQELDRRLRGAGSPVMAVACHPGVAATELMRHGNALARAIWPLVGKLLNSPAMGAWPALQAATDPAARPGGFYGPQGLWEARGPSGEASRTRPSLDAGLARRLWDLSVELTGVDPLPPAP
ncbi:MAG: SDR family NAD(P)-dependent oxidoreductase [Sphingomonadales bacterium]|nr:SDR family NAD(P)-dependent oxidoreductase [Sphingomonadales bacterium]